MGVSVAALRDRLKLEVSARFARKPVKAETLAQIKLTVIAILEHWGMEDAKDHIGPIYKIWTVDRLGCPFPSIRVDIDPGALEALSRELSYNPWEKE